MGKPKGGAKGPKGVKGGGRGKGKINAQNVYSAQERSQAYLVNAERVAAGLAPASIASICRSRRRSAARHAELNLSELARRSEPQRLLNPQLLEGGCLLRRTGERQMRVEMLFKNLPLTPPDTFAEAPTGRVKLSERSFEPTNQSPVGGQR